MVHLNVDSENLVYVRNVSYKGRLSDLKSKISAEIGGGLNFIETFEAWTVQRSGHMVFEFNSRDKLMQFVRLINLEEILDYGVIYQIIYHDNRDEFFKMIQDNIYIDLIKCKGIPPNAQKRPYSSASNE